MWNNWFIWGALVPELSVLASLAWIAGTLEWSIAIVFVICNISVPTIFLLWSVKMWTGFFWIIVVENLKQFQVVVYEMFMLNGAMLCCFLLDFACLHFIVWSLRRTCGSSSMTVLRCSQCTCSPFSVSAAFCLADRSQLFANGDCWLWSSVGFLCARGTCLCGQSERAWCQIQSAFHLCYCAQFHLTTIVLKCNSRLAVLQTFIFSKLHFHNVYREKTSHTALNGINVSTRSFLSLWLGICWIC